MDVVKCATCKFMNNTNAKNCFRCRNPMSIKCNHCEFKNNPLSTHCYKCHRPMDWYQLANDRGIGIPGDDDETGKTGEPGCLLFCCL